MLLLRNYLNCVEWDVKPCSTNVNAELCTAVLCVVCVDDKFFMYAMMICCIAASVLLVVGVIKVSINRMAISHIDPPFCML